MRVMIDFHFEFEPDTDGIEQEMKRAYSEHVAREELNHILKETSDPSSLFTITVEDDGSDHPIPVD